MLRGIVPFDVRFRVDIRVTVYLIVGVMDEVRVIGFFTVWVRVHVNVTVYFIVIVSFIVMIRLILKLFFLLKRA